MTKRKLQANTANELRSKWAFSTGVEAAKRTISNHMRRKYWLKGFTVGVMVGSLVTCAVWWVQ